MNTWVERNKGVIEQFRANGGKVKGWAPLVLVTTKGAKSGEERIIPLMLGEWEGKVLAVASKGGAPKHPDWYYNLVAYPEVKIEVPGETYVARARILEGEERARAFEKAVEVFAPYGEYQKKAGREIPLFALERV